VRPRILGGSSRVRCRPTRHARLGEPSAGQLSHHLREPLALIACANDRGSDASRAADDLVRRASRRSTRGREAWFDDGVEVEDATRRTRLAVERTYLAWWRSGLTSLAVGLGAGKLVPELSSGASWPYELLGVAYSLLGIAFIAFAHRRQRAVEAALRSGEWEPLDQRVAAVLTAVGIVLGAATIAAVLFAGA
jgi:putative membrane protein